MHRLRSHVSDIHTVEQHHSSFANPIRAAFLLLVMHFLFGAYNARLTGYDNHFVLQLSKDLFANFNLCHCKLGNRSSVKPGKSCSES